MYPRERKEKKILDDIVFDFWFFSSFYILIILLLHTKINSLKLHLIINSKYEKSTKIYFIILIIINIFF